MRDEPSILDGGEAEARRVRNAMTCILNQNNYGQRTGVNKDGTAFASTRDITWGYNSKGEVVTADSSITGLDRAYQYDGIGNRLKSAESLTLPSENNYTPNALNQYTTVNSVNPVHDDDGNATAYPLPANLTANSTLVWDGENRLISATVTGGNSVTFVYDSQSRRIAETVDSNTTVYVYDGWNPIAEYSTTFALTKTYTWGIDLSGSMQGAGGVGGLLAVTDGTGTYYPTFDGNGNVSEYLDSSGNTVAHYEYDPFGKTTVATGSKAADFSHRFSTKPLDITTGLYYYGYRFYDPEAGRWPSRDPIEEDGGLNLYGFVGNSPLEWIDILGGRPLNIHIHSDWYNRLTRDVQSDLLNNHLGRDVAPGPPHYIDQADDIASTLAWIQELESGNNSDLLDYARDRLDDIVNRDYCPPSVSDGEPYDPNSCFCKSGIWEGVLTYGTIGLFLNKGNFTGTMTCSGETDKKMKVEGDAWGLGLFFGWSGKNNAYMKMLGNLPSDLKGTSQGCLLDIGGGISILSAGVNFPISPSGTGQPFRLPTPNIGGIDLPFPGHAGRLGFPKKLPSKIGTGFNWVGFNVTDASCL